MPDNARQKAFSIAPNVWVVKNFFVNHVKHPDDTRSWVVYNKFEDATCKDFLFEANNLPSLVAAINFFREDIEDIVCPELDPDFMINFME